MTSPVSDAIDRRVSIDGALTTIRKAGLKCSYDGRGRILIESSAGAGEYKLYTIVGDTVFEAHLLDAIERSLSVPELWDKLRQIRWEHLADLPAEVAGVMLEAADFVEAAMSQPQSTSTSLSDALAPFAAAYDDCFDEDDNDATTIWESGASMLLTVGDLRRAALAIKSKEQSND